jgi:flagellar biosynthetic protein FliR
MIVSVSQTQVFFLALTRILAILIKIPVLGGKLIPSQIKIGLGILLAIILVPWQLLTDYTEPMGLLPFAFAVGEELLIGTLAGFAAEMTFGALEIAGEMMGLTSGFFAAKIINPAFDTKGSPLTNFFYMVAVTYFLIINGHHLLLFAVRRTFEILPIDQPLPVFPAERLFTLTGGLIAAGVQMALPIVGALMLTNLTLGLLARVAPQIHVFFLGIPLKIGLGILTLMVTMSSLLPILEEMFNSSALWMVELLGG